MTLSKDLWSRSLDFFVARKHLLDIKKMTYFSAEHFKWLNSLHKMVSLGHKKALMSPLTAVKVV
jgi:hypothetical protein